MHITATTNGLAPCHVDDLLFIGTKKFHETVIKELKKTFPFGEMEDPMRPGGIRFTGSQIIRDKKGIIISMSKYIDNIQEIP